MTGAARTWRTAAAVLLLAALVLAGRLADRGLPRTTLATSPTAPVPSRPAAVTGVVALPGEGIVQLVAGEDGTLWALGHSRVFGIDARSGRVAASIPLPGRGEVGRLTVAGNGVWVLRGGVVLRIDPAGGRVAAALPAGGFTEMTVGPASVWLWSTGVLAWAASTLAAAGWRACRHSRGSGSWRSPPGRAASGGGVGRRPGPHHPATWRTVAKL